ncbi:hypothetical protein [Paenibacillus senegalensis]|uniref:hypothetical protein n=1 Tax=Paenibacillus senegalensis TaxID=1465766 RepID=UPI00028A1B8B|nr:hypothetical protein [Paenibacillus senegalensis]
MKKRYSLQKLSGIDPLTGQEIWHFVLESDQKEAIMNFLGHNYRIIDTKTMKEVARSSDCDLNPGKSAM